MTDLGKPPRELRADLRFRLIGFFGALLIRIWGATLRVDWLGLANLERIERLGGRVIYTFWHARLLTLTYTHRDRGVVVLVSQHEDGEIISQILSHLGSGVVRGSSSRDGLRALLQIAREGRKGHPLGVTPDGPRGPRQELEGGVLHIAQRSGLPIVPLAVEAVRRTELASWDRFQIPHPFSRVVVVTGEPISIPPDLKSDSLESRYGPQVVAGLAKVEEEARAWRARRTVG